MKKFLIVCFLLFTVSVACKKENVGGERLCACSVMAAPTLQLAVKGVDEKDLLNTAVSGSYQEGQIQLYQKDNAGNMKQIQFRIREPFNAGSEKFGYYQIESAQIIALVNQNANQVFYLKLGNKAPLEISLSMLQDKRMIKKLLIDQKEVPVASDYIAKFANVYTISL
ncbi:hypothetical protein VRU48_07480 [Pedobacter sp. KR3-3]|uniref:Uncharacterized protein n=1 Tax=Pedobacter albus TaxID=3113905 RepID=A0ABU7I652_9SPHI|nr:hypothetical protein [Pedobacter sp. KR3-3]MEE1944941.1 hypothetical protein [Pedobacter sp. KR3-3]